MITIIKEYMEEGKTYLHKIKNKFRKFYRKFIYFLYNLKTYSWQNISNGFKVLFSPKNRGVLLLILGIFVVVNLLFLLNFPSLAIYQNVYEFPIVEGIVGNIYGDYDYTLLVYVENIGREGRGNGTYKLVEKIPTSGYTYSGYKCDNGSALLYDSSAKITSVTIGQKEVCYIYFDLISGADITISVMLETEPGSNNYLESTQIPYYGYEYSHYECANNGTLSYNSETHSVNISSKERDYCSIYFTKISSDITVYLYVETDAGTDKYVLSDSIPVNIIYTLNAEKSTCLSKDGETIDNSISYKDGYINIDSSQVQSCDVYLGVTNV